MAPAVAEAQTVINAVMLNRANLVPSPLQVRKHFNQARLEEMAATMGNGVGILEPLLVRSTGKRSVFEIIAGERRWRSAEIAGLDEVPVVIRDLTDAQVVEIMVIENDEREDVTPLERADGYSRLLKFGFSIKDLAARIGHTPRYVSDQIKLLDLTCEAANLLDDGRITVGHAIVLARLTPEQQARVIADGLFQAESFLWDPAAALADGDADPLEGQKARTVREMQGFINETFRFPLNPDPELFPETATAIDAAIEQEEKVISITYKHQVQPDVKAEDGGKKIYGPMSWRQADGKGKSKTCDASVTGVIVIGPHRGDAFKVCIDKACDVHWKKERLEREKMAKARTSPGTAAAAPARESWERQEAEREQKSMRFEKAKPAILEACAAKVKTLAVGKLVTQVLSDIEKNLLEPAVELLGTGKSAEHALRLVLMADIVYNAEPYHADRITKELKAILGVDVAAIIKKANAPADSIPVTPPAARGKSAKKSSKKRS